MTQLYINNQLVELSEEIDYTINKTLFNLDDISSYQLDYSKTIKVPITDRNIEVFGYRNGQRVLTDLDGGLGFENTIDNKYRLYDNNRLISSGYVKFVKTHYSSKDKYFEITLNSDIANWANQLKDLSFATRVNENFEKDDDSKKTLGDYLFNDKNSFNIDKDKVYESWNNPDYYIPKGVSDMVGFVQSDSGVYDDFDSKRKETYSSSKDHSNPFYDITTYTTTSQINFTNDVTEAYTNEFRSYYQRPFVYTRTLFNFIKEISKKRGFNIQLDPSFFNKNNNYYSSTAVVFPRLSLKSNSTDYVNIYNPKWSSSQHNYSEIISSSIQNNMYLDAETEVLKDQIIDNTYIKQNYEYDCTATYTFLAGLYQTVESRGGYGWRKVSRENGATIKFYLADENYKPISNTYAINWNCLEGKYQEHYPQYNNIEDKDGNLLRGPLIFPARLKEEYQYKGNLNVTEVKLTIPAENFKSLEKTPIRLIVIKSGNRWYNPGYYLEKDFASSKGIKVEIFNNGFHSASKTTKNGEINLADEQSYQASVQLAYRGNNRTKSKVTIERICGSDFKLFDFIKNYCKIFNLQILQEGNKIKICQIPTIFKNYKKVIPKIDRSKWEINNNVFENKYFYLNWVDDKDNYLQNLYLENNNIQCGEKKISTNYNFNNNSKTIQSFFKSPITQNKYIYLLKQYNETTKDEIKEYDGDYSYQGVLTTWSCLRTKDNKIASGKYFGFINNTSTSAVEYNITDDPVEQISNNSFCWGFHNEDVKTSNKCKFVENVSPSSQDVDLFLSTTFSIPNNYYYSISETDFKSQHQNNIYSLFWEKWFKDLYLGIDTQTVDGQEINQNSQPAILTTKMLIESTDWNRLYYIDGSYWILNKIKDYNPNSKEFTEVELLKIQNIDNYTTNNYLDIYGNKYGYFEPETDSFVIGSDGGIVEVKYYTNLENTEALRTKIDKLRPSNVSVYTWNYSDDGYYTYNYQIPKSEKGVTYEFVNKNNISEAANDTLVTITQLSKEDSADIDLYADQYTTICYGSSEGDDTITVTYKPEKFDNVTFPDAIDDLTVTTTVNYDCSVSFVRGKIGPIGPIKPIKQYEKGSFTIKFKSNINLSIGKTKIIYYPIKYTLGEETRTIVIKILIKGTAKKIIRR